ncbi:alpha/beta-hydrolase [Periconia macrospinosa]|uniref:Carboxylic ester hydrolase n=1 Tax=Periconia macrospinosa TaxID=97972 RepID=A0A2V1D080_9PLEO|nr:alpha/beta-hydrolase [Periconia macrospinosa]
MKFSLITLLQKWKIGQLVSTSSGTVIGGNASNGSEVSGYFGIPYAKPPIGDLRFAPPQKFEGRGTINATSFGASCPISSAFGPLNNPNYTNANLTTVGKLLVPVLEQEGDVFSEDCLTLNVWTKPQVGEKKKAVMVWIVGGGWTTGTTNNVYGNSGEHLADEGDVIVVSMNYRLNIFGFPGMPDHPNNLALLDHRLAVEWVRENIAGFGGDPSRIILFGQSAGAEAVDFYSYAWTKDPIIKGLIPQSGSTGLRAYPKEKSAAAWYNVTSTLGCGDSSSNSSLVLECMRHQTTQDIQKAIPLETRVGGSAAFWPTVDETVVFSDYSALAAAGKFIKVPLLTGNTDNEAGFFKAIGIIFGVGEPDTFWDQFNLATFVCPSATRANFSIAAHLPTWRYRYFGSFPNLQIETNPDTYHSSELSLLFDNLPPAGIPGIPPPTEFEGQWGTYIRRAWTTFAKDPEKGLERFGWPRWNPERPTLIRLGYGNRTGPNEALPQLYDRCD